MKRQGNVEPVADTQHHLRGEQRIAAEFEELVRRSDTVDAEHLRPDIGNPGLERRRGRHEAHFIPRPLIARLRQRAPVEFAIRRAWQRGQHENTPRHHIVGQARGKPRTKVGFNWRRTGRRHDIGHQPAIAGMIDRHGRRLLYAGLIEKRGLDLTEFDPIAANLHLRVGATEIFEITIGEQAREIARTVEALARPPENRDEALRVQFGTVEITTRNPGATDKDFAHETGRRGAAVGIAQRYRPAGNGEPDQAAPARFLHVAPRDPPGRDMHGGLRDAEHVDQRGTAIAVSLDP